MSSFLQICPSSAHAAAIVPECTAIPHDCAHSLQMRRTCELKTFVGLCIAATMLSAAFGCSKFSSAETGGNAVIDREDDSSPRVVEKAVIPSGTVLRLSLIDALDSQQSSAGDHFEGSLAEPVVINGAMLLPKGTLLHGRVIDVQGAGKVKGRAGIKLELTKLIQGNKAIGITTAVVLATKGKEVHYGPKTNLNFTLTNSVNL